MKPSNVQTNTFLGGMNLDVDVAYLKPEEYRYAENIKVITNDTGTTATLLNIDRIIEVGNLGINQTIIGTATTNNVAAIVTAVKDNNIVIYNNIYYLTFKGDTINKKIVLSAKLGYTTDNISLVINYEYEDNVKLYISNLNSSIRVIKLTDDKYVDTGNNPLLDTDGLVKDVSALDLTPSETLDAFTLVSLEKGLLKSGMVLYAYLLFNIRGSSTTLSPLSQMMHITSSNEEDGLKDFEGTLKNKITNKACKLQTTITKNNFEMCRIYRIHYESNTTIPKIYIVDEVPLVMKDSKFIFTDFGNVALNEITIDQFNSITSYLFKAGVIEKSNNRLFAANILEETWNPEYDARAYRSNINGLIKLSSTYGLDITFTSTDPTLLKQFYKSIEEKHDCINPFNLTKSSEMSDDNSYEYSSILLNGEMVKGGSGLNISYTFITVPFKICNTAYLSDTNLDELTIDIKPESTYNILYYNPETQTTDAVVRTYNNVLPNYASSVLASKYRSHLRDEVYRFGIVLRNDKNIASPVHWIGDIRMPHAASTNYAPFQPNDNYLEGRPLGIKFKVNNLPVGCVSYEIVRCDRTEEDRTIISQTALSLIGSHTVSNSDRETIGGDSDIRPYGILTYSDNDQLVVAYTGSSLYLSYLRNALVNKDLCTMISPEISILGDISNKISDKQAYIDTIYGLCSSVTHKYNASGTTTDYKYNKSRMYGTASRTKSTNYTKGEITFVFNGGTTMSSDSNVINLGNYISSSNYNAIGKPVLSLIGNYYYPFGQYEDGDYNTKRIGRRNINIKKSIYPKSIPYNFEKLSLYYDTIADKNYLNLGQTDFYVGLPTATNWSAKEGAFGPCLVSHIPGLLDTVHRIVKVSNIYQNNPKFENTQKGSIVIANIKKNSTQYGGDSYSARLNSKYINTNSDIVYDTAYTFGGDTYLNVLDYPTTAVFQRKDAQYENENKVYVGAYIPFESSINLSLLNGSQPHESYRLSDGFMNVYALLDPVQMGSYYVLSEPFYDYNDAYSSDPTALLFVSKDTYSIDNYKANNRIVYSDLKVNNQVIDSWANFKVANYLDVDGQYGSITSMHNFKDRLLFWQDNAFGVASVNDRSLISDNIGQLTLGTGDVLSRYDYLTTVNGSNILNDRSIVFSGNSMYWFDSNKSELCRYSNQVTILSKDKNVLSWFNQDNRIINSVYDKKYNEVWFVGDDKSLIFNEQTDRFTSFYTISPEFTLHLQDRTIVSKQNDLLLIDATKSELHSDVNKSIIQLVVNKDILLTKVFDNVFFQGNFDTTSDNPDDSLLDSYNKMLQSVVFDTDNLKANIFDKTDYREYTFRFAIGRNKLDGNGNRMRGKYLKCSYEFLCTQSMNFSIPFINTTYRISLV